MEETLEGGRGPSRAVVRLEREREREREREISAAVFRTCIRPVLNIVTFCYQELHLKHVTWEGTNYEILEDDTIVSKHVVV
jgi:hypothetical protein